MNNTPQQRVDEAASLIALCDILNCIHINLEFPGGLALGMPDFHRVEGQKLGDFIRLDNLKTFGGTEPEDTEGIFSWDSTHVLVPYDSDRYGKFAIVPRGES